MALPPLATAAPVMLVRRGDPLDKLRRERESLRLEVAAARRRAPGGSLRADAGLRSRLASLAPIFEPKSQRQISDAPARRVQAGYRSRSAAQTCFAARAPRAAAALTRARGVDASALTWSALGGVAVGTLPSYWVTRRRQALQDAIARAFPDALDMLLVCVEARQSFDMALMRIADEIAAAHPELSEEFHTVSAEIRGGKHRATVLREMAERAGAGRVSAFVTVLAQVGASIAESLRVYAAEMRDKRMLRAEEKANILPAKLTLGTMLFTVPPLMIIMIGPSLLDIADFLAGVK